MLSRLLRARATPVRRLKSAGVAGRPLVGRDLAIRDWVGSSGCYFDRFLLAQTVALELQAMGVVDDAVEDGVGESGLADQVMPAVDRDLTGNQRSATAIAVLDDFEHVVTLLGPEWLKPPIVEDQQLDTAKGAHQSRVAAIAASECKIAEHPRHALIEHRAVVATGLVAECASQPTFADAGGWRRAAAVRRFQPLD